MAKQSDNGKNSKQNKVGPWLFGALGGAVIVGAVWGITATVHPANPVVATVGSTPIRQSDFTNQLEKNSGNQVLQQLVSDQLIQDGAKKYNITASQQDITNSLNNLKSQYGITDSSQLNQLLAANNMTMDDLNTILKTQVLEQKLSERNVTVTDTEIQDYYNAHKSDFTKKGDTKPQPLSAVKSQIVDTIKQSKATSPTDLLASLAKDDTITVKDAKYQSVVDQIKNPPPASSSAAPPAGSSAPSTSP